MPVTVQTELEDGRTVYVTLPQRPINAGAFTKAIQAEIDGQRYTETAPTPPTVGDTMRGAQQSIRQGYQDVIAPVTRAVSGLIQGGGNAMQADAYPGMAMAGVPIPTDRPPQTTEASDTMAGMIVPQTLTQAGTMVGTMGAGGLAAKAGLTGLPAALTRVGGATVGGETGNQLTGGTLGVGAMEGAGSAGLGEVLGAGYSFLRKSAAGGMTAIAQKALDDFRSAVGSYLPGVLTPKNASGVKEVIRSGKLLDEAGTKYAESVRQASDAMGNNMINVPALADKPMPRARIAAMLKEAGYGDAAIEPGMAVNLPTDVAALLPAGRLSLREATDALAAGGYGQKKMTLSEAVEALKQYGFAGYSGTKEMRADRTLAGRPSREQWEQALQQIRGEVQKYNPTGEAIALFDAGRKEYAVASTVHGMLKGDGVYIGVPNDVRFNPNAVRGVWERKFQKVKDAVPTDEFAAITDALYGGGPFGSRDLVRGGPDTVTAAPSQLLRSGGGAGTTAVLPARALFPGMGNQYTGRQPFALGQGTQTGIDLGVQGLSFPMMRDLGFR